MTDKIVLEAVEKFNRIYAAVRQERENSLEDRRFYSIAGAQWEGGLGEQFANKPRFEVNKIHLSVMRIFNEYRNNRISVDYVAKDGKKTDLSDTCDGLYRADEQNSSAIEAYDNAFEEAVGGGFGAWRLRSEYEDPNDDENENQRIEIEPIYEADSCVFFDLDSKKQDKSDANYAFVLHSMTKEAFEKEYGEPATDFGRVNSQQEFDWTNKSSVYVAEYYEKEKKKITLYHYEGLNGEKRVVSEEELERSSEIIEVLQATGFKFVKERKVKKDRVRKYILTRSKMLEDCGYIAGTEIPIIPVYGKRWFVDNLERCMGHVRMSKDVQRLKNMQLSRLAEIAALSPIEKPILYAEEVAPYATDWANDNINNNAFLLLDPIKDKEGNQLPRQINYTRPPQIPPALAGLLTMVDQDIQELLGRPQEGEQMGANLSGKAIELVQNRLDMQSYIYMDNMSKAMKRCGQIWLSMARELYVEEGRGMKIVTEQGDVDAISLMEPAIDEDTGEEYYKHDLSKANLEVFSSVGPSSVSRKESTIRSLLAMIQATADPETIQILSSMIMVNMEGEGIKEVRDYFRKKMVIMGAVKPNKQEEQEIAKAQANQQPTTNDRLLQAAALKEEALAQKAVSDAENAEMDTLLKGAQIDKVSADTAKVFADIDDNERQTAINLARQGINRTSPKV